MKKDKLNIFISRNLAADSFFTSFLEEEFGEKYLINILGQSGLELSPLSFELPENFDAVCFYSQHAFQYFVDQLVDPKIILSNKSIIAFGAATAKYIEERGFNVDVVGDSEVLPLSKIILKTYSGKKVLFPQAVHSRNSLKSFLDEKMEYIELKVYSNDIKYYPEFETQDVLVFTSPRNVLAFVKRNKLKGKIVAIGATTGQALINHTDDSIIIADRPDELSLAKAVSIAIVSEDPA